MTQEQINELRKAISEVSIPHEWRAESAAQAITEVFVGAGGGQWSIASTQDLPKCLFPANANYPVFRHSQRDAIARYIAAANPAAVLELIRQRDELMEALKDAREMVSDWAGYASPYFQEKHDIDGDLKKLDDAIARMEG